MPVSYPARVAELLAEGRIMTLGLMRFDLGSGSYGFVRNKAPYTVDGLEYVPGGIISVSALRLQRGFSANTITIELAESPDDGLTPDVLQQVENEDYRWRPVTFKDVWLDPDDGSELHVRTRGKYLIDTIDHDEDPSKGYVLRAIATAKTLDNARVNGRRRTDADQCLRNPADRFMEHRVKAGREKIYWGRTA